MSSTKKKDNLCYRLCCTKECDMEISRLRKENAHLKKALDELSRQKGEPVDSENELLLERILSLETIRERNSQHLMAKDEEIASLRKQLRMTGEESDAHLQELTDYYVKGKEQREKLLQALQTETEEVKNKLVTISASFQDLESRVAGQQDCNSDGQASTSTLTVLHNHLRDALEKNQQWLAYDQEREAYVKATLARMSWLEQQLTKANQALSQQHNEALSDERKTMIEMQEHYYKLLITAENKLEALREQVNTAPRDPNEMQWRYEERQREVDELKQQLQTERLSSRGRAQEENCRSGDRESRQRAQDHQSRLDEEKHRSAELLVQIQIASKDLEDEKQDCLYLEKHLHRVLKELRKSKDHVAKLSQRDQQDPSSCEASSHKRHSKDRVTYSPRISALLDESFLECPGCRAQYPSSQHRELLAHLDHCLD